MPQTKNSKKTSAKSGASAKKGAAAKNKQKTAVKKTGGESSFFSHAAPFLLVVLAVLAAVCVIMNEGVVGKGIRGVLCGLFGGAAYALPLFLLVRALFWNRDREEQRNVGRTCATAIEALLLCMMLHLIFTWKAPEGDGLRLLDAKTFYTAGQELKGGGVTGGILGELLASSFGQVFSMIVLIVVMLLVALYIAGLTPRGAGAAIAYHASRFAEKRREKKALKEERKQNLAPTKSQVKEEEYLAYLREKKRRQREALERAVTEPVAGKNSGRAAFENAVTEPVSGQLKMEFPAPTPKKKKPGEVYHVRKRRLTELDIPVSGPTEVQKDENLISLHSRRGRKTGTAAAAAAADADKTGWAADAFRDPDGPDGLADADGQTLSASETAVDADPEAIDEKIFDEVMRRTRERVEKSRKENTLRQSGVKNAGAKTGKSAPAPDDSGDFLPDAEQSGGRSVGNLDHALGLAEGLKEKERIAAAAGNETDTVSLATQGDGEFDVKDIFVHPEDAELIEKLSRQFQTSPEPLDVKRKTVSEPEKAKEKPEHPEYKFPPLELLTPDAGPTNEDIRDELEENAVKLVDTLKTFRVNTKIENISRGPTITRYELLPEAGTRVRSITNLVDDIALNLATTGVRIEAPIPGKSAVGIEVPNKTRATVHLRTLLENDRFIGAKSRLTVALGEDVAGDAVYFDIAKMPHLLIAGATGSGKSVCINSVITSLLYKASPEDVKMILIDPKKVEMNIYNGIPHLLVPVISEPKKAAGSLSWAVSEMERRYGLIEDIGARSITEYNRRAAQNPDYEYLPSIVIVIDELADLMMTAKDDVEESICRIAQKARAAGMHLIIGTQRPDVSVITGLIKANIPSRIAFRTSSQVDSRTIIDIGSASNLIGMGDMLFAPVGANKPFRVQGAYVSEDDVEQVVDYIKNMNRDEGSYSDEIANQIEREAQKCGVGKKGAASEEGEEDMSDEDPMFWSALEVAVDAGKISTSLLQRRLRVGYGRGAKLIDRMEQLGYVSAPDGMKPRDVLISRQEFAELKMRAE
ncbi:MAG: DNA translocase FtsK 4TM domain-containing protein [Clostridia bacterium]|nr:DNA translocase FtsK 4TM domain-containing protein [Clostridia bacterium]